MEIHFQEGYISKLYIVIPYHLSSFFHEALLPGVAVAISARSVDERPGR